jgi:uncharacterized protein YifN (PemK superfamily)
VSISVIVGACGYSPARTYLQALPAVVISPRLPHRDRLCTVVPISSEPSDHDVQYVVRLESNPPLPDPFTLEQS